jgi:hypothetical protein
LALMHAYTCCPYKSTPYSAFNATKWLNAWGMGSAILLATIFDGLDCSLYVFLQAFVGVRVDAFTAFRGARAASLILPPKKNAFTM